MSRYNPPFEIHVHGDVPLRSDVTFAQIQEALKPLWAYAGAKSLADGAGSAYEEEPGIRFEQKDHVLQICWTVAGDEDFRHALDEMCMGVNELAEQGAAIEVTFYDTDYDEEEGDPNEESRDDFLMLFVGPNPAAIMQVQRDLLVEDVVNLMERHFEGAEWAAWWPRSTSSWRPLRRAGQFAGNRQAPARRHRRPRPGQPRRRPPPASPALSSRQGGGRPRQAPSRRSAMLAAISLHWRRRWLCSHCLPCDPAFGSARSSAGPCTTSPTPATPRW